MSRIFISHSSRDNPKAAALRDWLVSNGWDDLFLDFDPQRGLVAGERWMDALRQAADRCEAVICLISEAWLASEWCEDEARMAWHWGKRIVCVLVDDLPRDRIPGWLSGEWQHVNLAAPGEHTNIETTVPPDGAPHSVTFHTVGLERLRLGLEKAGLSASTFAWPPDHDPQRPPYRGLLPLEAEDAGIFFGRDAQMVTALDELRGLREKGQGCLFVIEGASGAGKSSFLRAGLLPRLERDDRNFLPLPMIRPELAALTGETGLVTALEEACRALDLRVARAELRREVEQGADAVTKRLAALQAAMPMVTLEGEVTPPPPTIILPIDQGEELFVATGNGEGGRFLGLLTELLKGKIHLIACIAIRSEAFHHLQEVPLPQGVRRVPFDLPPVQRGAYQEIIEGPAEALPRERKLEIAPDLTERLLRDLERGAGADPLPLLAFTLERLYAEYGQGGCLELAHYNSLGGLSGSISAAMEAGIKEAQAKGAAPASRSEALALLRSAFIPWLCRVDPATRLPFRRVAKLENIPPETWGLVEELVDRRLLVSSVRKNGSEAGVTVIDVAHESLLRRWPVLSSWLREETDALLVLESVQRAASDWAASDDEDRALLLHRGGRLEDALALDERHDLAAALSDQDRHYLAACRAEERRQHRTRRRLWVAVSISSLLALMIFVMFRQMQEVTKAGNLIIAQEARQESDNGNYARGMLWALAASPQGGELMAPSRPLARAQLLRALDNNRLVKLLREPKDDSEHEQDDSVVYIAFSPANGNQPLHALTISDDGRARLWDAESGKRRHVLGEKVAVQPENFVELNAAAATASLGVFSSDGKRVLVLSRGNPLRLWDVASGNPLVDFADQEGSVVHADLSPDGTRVVTVALDNYDYAIRLWNAETGEIVRALEGHSGAVSHAVFLSASGHRRLLTVTSDGTVRLWNGESGALVRDLGSGRVAARPVFSSDGSRFLTVAYDRTVRLWDTETGRRLRILPHGQDNEANPDCSVQAAFSPDGSRVLTVSSVNKVQLWSAETGNLTHELASLSSQADAGCALQSAFSADGTLVLTGSSDNTVHVWHTESGQRLRTFEGQEGALRHAAFSPDGSSILTASDGSSVKFWDPASGQLMYELKGHVEGVSEAAFSGDGARVLVRTGEGIARLWDTQKGKARHVLSGHSDTVWQATFSPDGKHVVSAGADDTARLWNAETGDIVRALEGHEADVNHVAYSSDGKLIVTASDDGKAKLWDGNSGAFLKDFDDDSGDVSVARFSAENNYLVTVSDGIARIWDVETGTRLRCLIHDEEETGNRDTDAGAEGRSDGCAQRDLDAGEPGEADEVENQELTAEGAEDAEGRESHELNAEEGEEADGAESREIKRGAILYAAFDPKQNKLLVTTSDDGTARLWDAETGKITHTLKAHENSIPYAEFSPDGKHVVTTSADGTARIWNVETGEREALLAGHAGGVLHAAFSPDGKRVVTSSSDRTARLWNARTGKFLREIKGHKDDVVWAAFSPYDDTTEREVVTASNYGTVLTASRDGIARLWDVGSAALLREFKGHTAALSHAEFYNRKDGRNASSQGVRILTASYDGTVRLWQLPAVYFKEPAELVKHACEMAKKSGVTTFTDDEMSEPSFLIRFPKSRYYNDPCERPTLIKWQYYKHLLSRVIGEPVK